jgi:hypothetical protein
MAVALGAYAGQRYLEQMKQDYDKERSLPLVIVDDKAARGRENFIWLSVSSIQNPLLAAEKVADHSQGMRHTSLAEFVNRIKYQNLKDDKEIIDRLNAEVLAESDLAKRAYLDTRDTLNKNRAEKLTLLANEKTRVYNRLAQLVSKSMTETDAGKKNAEIDAAIVKLKEAHPADEKMVDDLKLTRASATAKPPTRNRRKPVQSPSTVPSIDRGLGVANEEQLAVWLSTLDKQTEDEQNIGVAREWINKADQVAQSQIKIIHETLRPLLSKTIIPEAKRAQGFTSESGTLSAFFDPRSVFNDKSGSYVIYQTLWLICIGVMVFFLIFLFFALMRPFPFFANRSETLAAQFESLLSRPRAAEGAAPQLARSLVVSAAALGVGTAAAVAVAGDRVINRPQAGRNNNAVVASAYEPGEGEVYPPGRRRPVDPLHTPLKVELTPQIIYPQPTVIEHPPHPTPGGTPFDPTLITGLQERVINLTNSNANLSNTVSHLQTEVRKVGEVEKGVAGLKQQVGLVQVPALESKVGMIEQSAKANESNLAGLDGRVGRMESGFATALTKISGDLNETKGAVSDLRNNSFERTQNSGGRNFFTRTKELFRGDRFMVSHQSAKSLEDLMCRENCPEGSAKRAIINVLKSLVGEPPISQSDFMQSFAAVNKNVLEKWKPLILKYTRVPY